MTFSFSKDKLVLVLRYVFYTNSLTSGRICYLIILLKKHVYMFLQSFPATYIIVKYIGNTIKKELFLPSSAVPVV